MLEACNLTYSLDHACLIEGISLRFQPGRLTGILGVNGAGKSTLLKTLAAIWKPSQGTVLWQGEKLHRMPRNIISKTVSLVPQSPEIHFDFLVKDIVAMGRYPHGRHLPSDALDLLEWALNTVDAWHLKERSILRISQGERKRVYIARAIISESPVLLLDEPSTCLDLRHQMEIWELLKKLQEGGKTIVVTTHDLASAEKYCSEAAILHAGKCRFFGSCQEALSETLLSDVFGVKKSSSPSSTYAICNRS